MRLRDLSLAHMGDIGRRRRSGFAGRRDQIAGPLECTVPETTQVVGIGGSLLWDLLRTRDGQERPPSRHMGSREVHPRGSYLCVLGAGFRPRVLSTATAMW